MKKDDIKTIIVVAIVCLICAILVLAFGIKSNFEKLEGLTEYNTFFEVTSSINEYINYISDSDSDKVYSLLHEDYIVKNEITNSNVFDYVSKFSSNESFKVINMKGSEVSKNYYLYYAEGKIIRNTYDGVEVINDDYKILIIYDYVNLTKAIYPINAGDNIKKIINSIKKKSIVKNECNEIKGIGIIKTEQICSLYLSDYVNYLFNDIDNAYELADTSMKNKYTTIKKFSKVINSKKDSISFIADKCYFSDDYRGRMYSVIDINGNRYYFKEKSIMDYSVEIIFYDESNTVYDNNLNNVEESD